MLAKERTELVSNKNSFMGSIVNEGRQLSEEARENFRRPPYWPVLSTLEKLNEDKEE